MNTPNHELSDTLRFLLTLLFSRARLVALVVTLCVLGAILACSVLPPIYTGGFSVLIKSPEIDRSIFGENADVVVRAGRIEGNTLSDEFEILTSPGLAQVVAEAYYSDDQLPDRLQIRSTGSIPGSGKLNAENLPSQHADRVSGLAGKLREKLEVTPVRDSDVIHIRLAQRNRDQLDRLVKLYADAYLRYRASIWFDDGAMLFFQEQAASSLADWEERLAAVREARQEADNLDPSVACTEIERIIADNLYELNDLETSILEDSTTYRALVSLAPSKAPSFLATETADNHLFWQLSEEIAKAKAARHTLATNYADGSTALVKADSHLDALYGDYKAELEQMLRNDLISQAARRAALTSNIESSRQRVSQLKELEHRVAVMKLDAERYRDQYNMYAAKALEMAAQNNMRVASTGSITILSPPGVAPRPTWPSPRLLIPLAAFLGLVLSLTAVFLRAVLRDSFSLPEDVTRQLGLPVVASFPDRGDREAVRASGEAR
jgi:uncharacterized protein involved in exopolysaccharide biosynthesis